MGLLGDVLFDIFLDPKITPQKGWRKYLDVTLSEMCDWCSDYKLPGAYDLCKIYWHLFQNHKHIEIYAEFEELIAKPIDLVTDIKVANFANLSEWMLDDQFCDFMLYLNQLPYFQKNAILAEGCKLSADLFASNQFRKNLHNMVQFVDSVQ